MGDPPTKEKTHKVKMVQRRAARWTMNDYARTTSVSSLSLYRDVSTFVDFAHFWQMWKQLYIETFPHLWILPLFWKMWKRRYIEMFPHLWILPFFFSQMWKRLYIHRLCQYDSVEY